MQISSENSILRGDSLREKGRILRQQWRLVWYKVRPVDAGGLSTMQAKRRVGLQALTKSAKWPFEWPNDKS